MASMTTIERLARWLHESYYERAKRLKHDPDTWEGISEQKRDHYRALATKLLNDRPGWLRKAMS